jgi:hypothetical protein
MNKENMENPKHFFGKKIILDSDVQYIGEGENPKDNIGFQVWEKNFIESNKYKGVLRCAQCNEERMADHVGIRNE